MPLVGITRILSIDGAKRRDRIDLNRKKCSQKEGVKSLFFCDLPTVAISSVCIVGGKSILAGIASDLVFYDRGREASAL